jgi:hypothetical protein
MGFIRDLAIQLAEASERNLRASERMVRDAELRLEKARRELEETRKRVANRTWTPEQQELLDHLYRRINRRK